MMRSFASSSLFSVLLFTSTLSSVDGQAEWTKPVNYTYDEPVVFNQWCQELRDMYGPSCTCVTTYGEQNNIYSVDLDHEILCDPLQGNITCVQNITIESARVWLKATSVGNEGDFESIKETAIRDFYVFMDDTDIGTVSFRFNDNIGQRRVGCEAVYGAINCPRCGVCDAAPHDKEAEVPNHLGPADIFRGISGQCRYGNSGGGRAPAVNLFDTCEDGPNVLTDLFWTDLEITSAEEQGACPGGPTAAPADEKSSASRVVGILGSTLASLMTMLA